jgi:pterin-4a-carbinolamine dehydratase
VSIGGLVLGDLKLEHRVRNVIAGTTHRGRPPICWYEVSLALSSYALGELTENEFQFAARIQECGEPAQPA